ncbi:MAG: hypothetical protein AB1641_30095 [Thermodesulfobacteriota bacterium]
MPKKKIVDASRLVESVESGRSSSELMAEFNIKTIGQLKSIYVDSLAALGRVPVIVTGRHSRKDKVSDSKEIRINLRGSLIVPRGLIETLGFQTGDNFSVRKTAAGVSLKKI